VKRQAEHKAGDGIKAFLDWINVNVESPGQIKGENDSMSMGNGNTSLQETAAKGVEAIHIIVKERDQLVVNSARMETDIALLRQKVSQLESRLGTAQTERDHYMRFSTDLVAKLNVIEMTIADAMRGAKTAAFAPPSVPAPQKQGPVVDTKSIETLIRRLPVNGGGDAAP
jgi:hypothetical protein